MLSRQHSYCLVRSTVVAAAASSQLRLAVARHAARQLYSNVATRHLHSNTGLQHLRHHRMFSTKQDRAGTGVANACGATHTAEESTKTFGDKLVILGLSLRGASLIPRLCSFSRVLRFAGTVPMLVGTLVTIYELGGWRLVLSIPVTTAALLGAGKLSDNHFEERLRATVVQELDIGCPDIPRSVIQALEVAPARQYETNSIRLDLLIPLEDGSGAQWRIAACASRKNMSQPWTLTSLQASRGTIDETARAHKFLPPQTRNWDCNAAPVSWQTVYQKEC